MKSMTISAVCILLVVLGSVLCPGSPQAESYQPITVHDVDLLDNGNILVTDGGVIANGTGSGIFEIDRMGNIYWSNTADLNWAHNADRQADGKAIISDTGHDRVIIIDQSASILWNSDDIMFSDGSHLNYPNDANILSNGHLLITDRDNHRAFETLLDGTIVWQFGQTGVPGNDMAHLRGPHNADRLSNGNTLIADSENNRIVEVTAGDAIVWTYAGGLDWPRDADRLDNGHTLINDSRNKRIIEVTSGGDTVWEYVVSDMCYDADRLASGNTLLGTTEAVLEVDTDGLIVWMHPATYVTEVIEGYLVIAPNGNRLWTQIIQPRSDLYQGQSFPALVNVSGGIGAGEGGNMGMAREGFVEFHFNAEGRGTVHPSDGVEDYNGFISQDDLKAVIEFALAQDNVTEDNLGVVTHSYGVTMGAGCLGRYPDLPVKYFIDEEGPSESFVTCHEPWTLDEDPSNDRREVAFRVFGHYSIYRDSTDENIAWWSEREATRFIGDIQCRYARMQAEWDHAQPPTEEWPGFDYPPLWYPCKHGVDLVNLATQGYSTWTRMNGSSLANPANTTYSREIPPWYYSGTMRDNAEALASVICEMAGMPAPVTTPGDVNGDGVIDVLDVVRAVNIILGAGAPARGYELRAADMNEDSGINVLDVVLIVNVILGGK